MIKVDKKSLLLIWGLLVWTNINANDFAINKNIENTKNGIMTTISTNTDIQFQTANFTDHMDTISSNIKQEEIEALSNELWDCIAESMISYFNNEIVAYKFNQQEQIALKKDIAEYFSQNNIFQIKQDKIVINIDKAGIYKLFQKFLPHFMPKLKWYSKLWIKLLWINNCCNIVYKDISKYKGKEAETFYLEDVWTLVTYVRNWIKKKYPTADITVWEYLYTILNAIPNEYMHWQLPTYSQNFLNQPIANIKTVDPKQK